MCLEISISYQLGAIKFLPNGHHRGKMVCRTLDPCSVFVKASNNGASVVPTNANAPNADPLKKVAKLVQNLVELIYDQEMKPHETSKIQELIGKNDNS